MSKSKQKLELTWIGKDREVNLEPRILVEVPEKSYGDKNTENMLIHGDNLLALKALEQDYTGKVKCIYIDPPYNTGARINADGKEIGYDDNLEHSIWLTMMQMRIKILYNLLSDDGSIWISIDEKESHYLKILCDEIFGRNNFIIQTTIQRGAATGHKAINPTPVQVCDLMISYAKNKENWIYQPVYKERDYDKAYNQIILNYEENYEKWEFTSLTEYLKINNTNIKNCLNKFPERIIRFAQPDYNSVGQETRDYIDLSKQNPQKIYLQRREGYPDIYLINGNRILFYKDKMKFIDGKYVTAELVTNLWDDMNYQGIAKEGSVTFKKGKKPEIQIRRLLEMSTNKGDLVLDSFLGSGTTAAVAHKMGRKWIGIELGDHCYTHCEPRLQKVIDGTDQGGISKAVNWQGGGGYKFYELAPSLLKKDEFDNWIIEPKYDAEMLAEAMAKHEGYKFSPDENNVYKQGKSTEKDFIFTTTQFLSLDLLNKISSKIEEDESLLICATHFEEGVGRAFSNITVKKIPQMLLDRCEFGKLEYNLNIVEESQPEDFEDEEIMEDEG
ncbi:MAG: site-specific DNA-methyltransferase [Candidatus Gastranaerophilaceae bacterium]